MALPSHLLEAKKRMEASKQESEVKAEGEAPVEQQQAPVQEPVVEQAQSDEVFALDISGDDSPAQVEQASEQPQQTQQNAEVDRLKKEVDQYKARWETLQGKFRKSEERVQALTSERAVVDNELNALRSKVHELEKQIRQLTKKPLATRIQESLTEEERAIHGDTIPVISKVAEQIQSSHEEELDALRKKLEEQERARVESATQAQVNAFHSAFRARVPDAEKVASDPSWVAFTQKKDAISGKPISAIWEEQVNAMNVDGLVKIIEAWRKTQNASKTPAPPKTPSLSAAAPQPQFTQPGRFKYSDFKKASEAYRQNIRDPATKKSYEETKKRFEDAKDRGLVDYAA